MCANGRLNRADCSYTERFESMSMFSCNVRGAPYKMLRFTLYRVLLLPLCCLAAVFTPIRVGRRIVVVGCCFYHEIYVSSIQCSGVFVSVPNSN